MALSNFEDQACLCTWVAALAPGPKQTLQAFVQSAQTILSVFQAQWIMVNGLSQLDDQLEKAALESLLAIYESTTDPIKAYITALKNYTAPFSDCPAVSTLGNTVNKIANEVVGPVDALSFKIQQYIDAIDDNTTYNDLLGRWISTLDDIVDAIDNC